MFVAIAFALKLSFFILCLGAILCVLFFVPLTLYVIPYELWVGFQNNAGRHLDKKKESLFQGFKNASHLYKCWILRKKPTF